MEGITGMLAVIDALLSEAVDIKAYMPHIGSEAIIPRRDNERRQKQWRRLYRAIADAYDRAHELEAALQNVRVILQSLR